MSKRDLLLFGAGGHSKSIIDIIESKNQWKIFGLVGDIFQVKNHILGYEIIGTDEDIARIREKISVAVIAIGKIGNCDKRRNLINKLEMLDFEFPLVSSSSSIVSKHASIGEGSTVGHGAIINAAADIGKHCILNTRCLIEHDTKIGDNCHISTGAILNGGVEIGYDCFIGSNAIIREGLKLPPKTVISAGKTIMGWPLKKI